MSQREGVLASWARTEALSLMASLGRRAAHVERVALLARALSPAFSRDRELLLAAAWLHDIGYAHPLANSGFHPLDGARWLRSKGHEDVARLVAHHSGARHEAILRGIDDYLGEFPFEDSDLDQALTYCDLTTGPDGRRVTLEWRIEEIQKRYGEDHVVAQAMRIGRAEFDEARENTERLMAEAGVVLNGSLAYPD